ncbi:MAG TPA: hypothetical protein VNO82_07820 [Solirubrobacteraceae bacterium]|nr:hypothetical protein [Solirubrobacteraceae bacterium]
MAIVVALVCASAAACGDSSESSAPNPNAVRTASPEKTFAPLVELAANERWRPASTAWFIDNSVLWFADGGPCKDRKVAVGRTLPEQRSKEPMQGVDWIYPVGLGAGQYAYYRNLHDKRCELIGKRRIYADQLSRPYDEGPRPKGLPAGGGFHLDLVDEVRGGPGSLGKTPVYVERANEGDGEVRLTYWMLFSMNAPPGQPAETHEGDWERVDVLLETDGPNRYVPRAIRLVAADGAARELAWRTLERSDGKHPILTSERGSHTLAPAAAGARCGNCVQWQTWNTVTDARKQRWYSFGGAWGAIGKTSATTGPLGPHGEWRPESVANAAANAG